MADLDWGPVPTIDHLRERAKIIADVRLFFAKRKVLEVETPLVGAYSVTDPHMDAIKTESPFGVPASYYLQTSPEYAMKRMIAAGFGSIFQICKSFRRGEKGSRHNPEFTMLEWYRPGFDHFDLMDEVSELMCMVLSCQPVRQMTYRQLFEQYLNIDPHSENSTSLERIAREQIDIQMQSENKDDWLNVLMTEIIEPQIGIEAPLFIYNYPASQCALAKVVLDGEGVPVAERFELYFRGVELANGYHELTDSNEQRRRFKKDQDLRQRLNRVDIAIDKNFMAAIDSGLPACAGVAMGMDRLIMTALELDTIDDVLSFPIDRA